MKDGDVDIHSHFEFGHDVAAASLPTDIPVGDQLDDKWIAPYTQPLRPLRRQSRTADALYSGEWSWRFVTVYPLL